jgi:hypothetical protein
MENQARFPGHWLHLALQACTTRTRNEPKNGS